MSVPTRRILLIHGDSAVSKTGSQSEIAELMLLCLETIPNCEVVRVNSGIEGVEKASVERIDAILLDLDEIIPDLCWQEIVNRLRQNSATNYIPVILLTATPQSQDILMFQKIRTVKAIAKNFDLFNLTTRISQLLNWQ